MLEGDANRDFISEKERKASVFRVYENCLTLLFCGNTGGDFKCKPLICESGPVYLYTAVQSLGVYDMRNVGDWFR